MPIRARIFAVSAHGAVAGLTKIRPAAATFIKVHAVRSTKSRIEPQQAPLLDVADRYGDMERVRPPRQQGVCLIIRQ